MNPGITTRPVDRFAYMNYLKKAEQFYEVMELSYKNRLWNASVVNAIHCAISAADALTVFYLGFRHAGEKHHDVIQLLQRLEIDKSEISKKRQQLSTLISIKNIAEYEERLLDEKDANNAMKACDRFYSWIKNKLK